MGTIVWEADWIDEGVTSGGDTTPEVATGVSDEDILVWFCVLGCECEECVNVEA